MRTCGRRSARFAAARYPVADREPRSATESTALISRRMGGTSRVSAVTHTRLVRKLTGVAAASVSRPRRTPTSTAPPMSSSAPATARATPSRTGGAAASVSAAVGRMAAARRPAIRAANQAPVMVMATAPNNGVGPGARCTFGGIAPSATSQR